MEREKFILYIGATLLPIRILATKKKVTLLDGWKNLTEHQKAIRDLAWDYGQRYGFEKTLTAIAWQESSFGVPRKLENRTEPSGGVFGSSYVTAGRRHFDLPTTKKEWVDKKGIARIKMVYHKPNKKQTAYIRNRLRVEPLFSAHHAVLQLQEGAMFEVDYREEYNKLVGLNYKIKGIVWKYIWAHYNGGTNCMKEPLALKYADDILAKVIVINRVKYKGE